MGPRAFEIVGFAGSLRQASFNRALLRAATELAPARLRITTHDRFPFRLHRRRGGARRARLRGPAP